MSEDDIFAQWSLMLSDKMLQFGLRPVGPASYDPTQDRWYRSFSGGHAVDNRLVSVEIAIGGAKLLEAREHGSMYVLIESRAGQAAGEYGLRAAGKPSSDPDVAVLKPVDG